MPNIQLIKVTFWVLNAQFLISVQKWTGSESKSKVSQLENIDLVWTVLFDTAGVITACICFSIFLLSTSTQGDVCAGWTAPLCFTQAAVSPQYDRLEAKGLLPISWAGNVYLDPCCQQNEIKNDTIILSPQKYRKGGREKEDYFSSLVYCTALNQPGWFNAEAENCTGTGKSRSGEMQLSWCQHIMKLQLCFSWSDLKLEIQSDMLSERILNVVLSSLICSKHPEPLLDSKGCHWDMSKEKMSPPTLPVLFLSLSISVSCSLWRANESVFPQGTVSLGPCDQTSVEVCCNLFATKCY